MTSEWTDNIGRAAESVLSRADASHDVADEIEAAWMARKIAHLRSAGYEIELSERMQQMLKGFEE